MGKALQTERVAPQQANGNGTAAAVVAPITDITPRRQSITMQGRDFERVMQWLREQLGQHNDAKPIVIFLRHVTPGRKLGDKLGTVWLKQLSPEDRTPELLAESAWNKAENYAQGLGGSQQQFALHSHYEGHLDAGESESSCYFWIKVSQQADLSIDSVPATEQGVLRLVMGKLDRIEDNFCDLMEGSATMMRVMREQIADMHSQALEDRKERRANEEEVRKAKLAELDRAATREAAKADQEARRELLGIAKVVGFAAARKWGGLDVRDAVSPGSRQLMTVFESLARDENRLLEILSHLNDTERAGFMEWWNGQIEMMERLQGEKKPGQPATAAAPTATPPAGAPAQPAGAPPQVPLAEQLKVAEAQAQAAAAQAAQWEQIKAAIAAEMAKGEQPTAGEAKAEDKGKKG